MFTAYILACSDGTYHSGLTKNLANRLAYHEQGKNPAAYTYARRPVNLVFQKSIKDIQAAIAFEAELQSKSIPELEKIIQGKVKITVEERLADLKTEFQETSIVVPSAYLGNLAYFAQIIQHQNVILDRNERFQKQTYRSRCMIYSANGLQNLVVPVVRPNGKETLLADILISYAEDWQKDHIKAIESAYRRAPYYAYYADDLFTIIRQKHARLLDLNRAVTSYLLECFGLTASVRIGTKNEESSIPLKQLMNPKTRLNFDVKAYQQVLNTDDFEDNLSLIDLLFNVGKEGLLRLKEPNSL